MIVSTISTLKISLTEKDRLLLEALPALHKAKQRTKADRQKELQETFAEIGGCLF